MILWICALGDISGQVSAAGKMLPDSLFDQMSDSTVQAADSTIQVPDSTVRAADLTDQVTDSVVQVPDSTMQAPDSTANALPDSSEIIKEKFVYDPDWSWLSMGRAAFADSVSLYDPGAPGEDTGGEPDSALQNPAAVTGPPDFDGNTGAAGFGSGGTIILQFTDNVFLDGPGPDLYFWMPDTVPEDIRVWISQDGRIFLNAGTVSSASPALDLAGIGEPGTFYTVVKLRDDSFQGGSYGGRLDAAAAIHAATVDVFQADSLFDDYILREDAAEYLQPMIQKISTYPRAQVLIEVYPGLTGGTEYSLLISQERAKTLRDYLYFIAGLKNYRYSAVGMSKSAFFHPFLKKDAGGSIVAVILYKG